MAVEKSNFESKIKFLLFLLVSGVVALYYFDVDVRFHLIRWAKLGWRWVRGGV
jgi:hypothetical protein